MSDKPRRAHVLKLEMGANSLDDLIGGLKQFALDLRLGEVSTAGCSGSPSVGYTYDYSVDEAWTKARYFAAIDAALSEQKGQG
jgi:hypothetical protein